MSLEKFIEDRISQAIAEGEFDNLEGRGKPLDLNWYFQTPEDLRMGYSILRSNNFLPAEAELLKEIDDLKKRLASCSDENRKKQITRAINEKTLSLNLYLERRRRK
ncbi:MAG TPA: DUF1992 domain-containing protein [Blastocatellia bacterium]|nr:DUF1992 domain-containing protein [Blastocatellia bacterium]